ncbi:MAG: Lrp/AsnC ligand binding domain-containing protein [Nitrososphaeraceae archaeon]
MIDLTKYTILFIDPLSGYSMLRVYLLINCNPEIKYEIVNYFEKLYNVINVDITSGPYDIVVELIFETMEDLKEKLQKKIMNLDKTASTLTLIRSEDN